MINDYNVVAVRGEVLPDECRQRTDYSAIHVNSLADARPAVMTGEELVAGGDIERNVVNLRENERAVVKQPRETVHISFRTVSSAIVFIQSVTCYEE